MKNAPIPLTLELWALGHSAGQIAEMLGYPNHKHVTRIIAHARMLGDPRAVYHAVDRRLLGKGIAPTERLLKRRNARFKGFIVAPVLKRPLCPAGHARTPENLTTSNSCRICGRIRSKLRQAKQGENYEPEPIQCRDATADRAAR